MDKKEFVWKRDWIHSYISNWCVFERFKFSNALSNHDILHIFGNEHVHNIKHIANACFYLRDLTSLAGIDEKKSLDLLGVNLNSRDTMVFKKLVPIIGTSHNYFINKQVTYCPNCIKSGFHSIFHQLNLFKYCVFHPNIALIDSCEKCDSLLGEYLLFNNPNPPFTCKCGTSLLDSTNVISIFNSWEKKFTIKDKELLNLLTIYKHQKATPVIIHPQRIFRMDEGYNQSALFLLINYTKNYYLDTGLSSMETIKVEYNHNSRSSKNSFKKALNNYNNIFDYRNRFHNLAEKDKIDAILFEIYIHSRNVYKAIKRYLLKSYLKKHKNCIHLNNELLENGTYCKFATAFTFWREEFEGINLSHTVRESPEKTKIFNFESYNEQFSIYTKGFYSTYLEDLLDSCFKNTRDLKIIDINQIKKIVSTLLSYFLLERFLKYLDLISNSSTYKRFNYYLPREVPMHLVIFDTKTNKTTIYHQNIHGKLKKIVQDIQNEQNTCGFDRNQKYNPYRTPLQLAIQKVDRSKD
ncbi:hypothetical protein [Lysinibacillus cavernae]|uniref:hypothetical protein n=1 Tax=Lysinibacillus cavernae TaxID=2666135 RepID=UPI0012D90919|nr:hypothetical protein [Lysinibacillus cavernae]